MFTGHMKKKWLAQIEPYLENGDIVLRRGVGLWSDVFANISIHDRRWSHVGLVKRTRQGITVLHAEANDLTGVGEAQESDLASFFEEVAQIGVARISLDREKKKQAVDVASSYVQRRIPFDMDFDLDDEGRKVYCTELIWRSYLEGAKIDLAEHKTQIKQKDRISVEDLVDSQLTQIIWTAPK